MPSSLPVAGRIAVVLGVLLAGAGRAGADEAEEKHLDSLLDLSLEELLNKPVGVASALPVGLRDSPAVITVISRDEIVASGARDLIDLLRAVPGFSFAVDVQGVIDVGFRGNWGHEGKVLLLVDGQEFNENLYSTLQLGNHFPLDQIEKVEIIRGPGSTIYGGNAELAVISVTSRSAAESPGFSATGTYGQLVNGLGRRTLSLSYGHQGESGSFTLGAFAGEGNQTDRSWTDQGGTTSSLANDSQADPLYLNAGYQMKELVLRAILDGYRVGTRDGLGVALPRNDLMTFLALHLDARDTFHPTEQLSLSARLNFKHQEPWWVSASSAESPLHYRQVENRVTGRLSGLYLFDRDLQLMGGVEAYAEQAHLGSSDLGGLQTLLEGQDHVAYQNVAAFSELSLRSALGLLVAGVRAEDHSSFGASLVPRLTLTKSIDRFHFKLLASRAFRAPGIENIALGANQTISSSSCREQPICPERVTALEVELGQQLIDSLYLSANAFYTAIDQTIVYTVDPNTSAEGYANQGRTGTRGVEADLRLRLANFSADLNYSFYTAAHANQVSTYAVPGDAKLLLGMPAHKLVLTGSLRAFRTVSLAPTAVLQSERYAWGPNDASGNAALLRIPPVLLFNLFVNVTDLGTKGLDLGVGVYNLFDADNPYPEPYNGGHTPLPGQSRELLARLTLRFGG
jgi:outer membrane receptor protein involved in Fe transport